MFLAEPHGRRPAPRRPRAPSLSGASVDACIVSTLRASRIAMSAYDLLAAVQRGLGSGTQMTVYRALDRLSLRGEVERVESLSAYRLRDAVDPLLLTCRLCGETTSVPVPRPYRFLAAQAEQLGFRLERLAVEGVGLCARCKQ